MLSPVRLSIHLSVRHTGGISQQECPLIADKRARRETMPKIAPVRSYNEFQSSRKSSVQYLTFLFKLITSTYSS